jgi:hypothetical protein
LNQVSFVEPELGVVDIPDDLIARIKPELRPGERLVWAGRPIRRPPLSMVNVYWAAGCLGLGYLLTAFFLALFFGVATTWIEPLDVFKILGSTLGALSGLATICWTAGGISDLIERGRVPRESYALTDQRALIWQPGETRGSIQIFSHDRGHFDRVYRQERPDGSGDLVFDSSLKRFNPGPRQFREVADVKRVEALARQFVIAETQDKDDPTTTDPLSIRRDIDT